MLSGRKNRGLSLNLRVVKFLQVVLAVVFCARRCSCCGAEVPTGDLRAATFKLKLICRRCRGEGVYEGRCIVCNDAPRVCVHLSKYPRHRLFSFEEVQRMHNNCFSRFKERDAEYKARFGHDDLIEKRILICSECGYSILRASPICPSCREKQESNTLSA